MGNFYNLCYRLTKEIPVGRVTTYKVIAEKLNSRAYRAVGSAMNRNPRVLLIPCHRVVNSSGFVGEYVFGVQTKILLLQSEGVVIRDKKILNFETLLFCF
jgi:methylated-DNA-[protein]-cysteine S-methyltransferase